MRIKLSAKRMAPDRLGARREVQHPPFVGAVPVGLASRSGKSVWQNELKNAAIAFLHLPFLHLRYVDPLSQPERLSVLRFGALCFCEPPPTDYSNVVSTFRSFVGYQSEIAAAIAFTISGCSFARLFVSHGSSFRLKS